VTSTVGFLAAPLAFDFVRSYYGQVDTLDWQHVNALFGEMEREGRQILGDAGVPDADITITRTADLRYVGQGHEVAVPLPAGNLGTNTTAAMLERFEQEYRTLYERVPTGNPVEALSWRMVVSAPRPDLPLHALATGTDLSVDAPDAIKGERPIYLPEERGKVPVPVYDRYRLGPGATFTGPAVVEERESTVIIGPGANVTVDQLVNLVVEVNA
jgi:N-methylhydantoinase A